MAQGQQGQDERSGSVSRRGLLKGAAAGAALATGGGGLLGATQAQAGTSSGGGNAAGQGDVALVNGKFVDGRGEVASAVSIRDGRIVAVGQPSGGGPGQTINLRGRTVVPGMHDAHIHFTRTGTNVGHETRHVEVAFSIAELQEAIAERAQTVPPGPESFITCDRGWTPLQFAEGRHATKDELDEAAPNHAVFLRGAQLGGATNSHGAAFLQAHGVPVGEDGSVPAGSLGAADAALRTIQGFEDKVRGEADIIAWAAEVGLTAIHDVGNVNIQPEDLPPFFVRQDYAPINALYHRNGRRLNTRMRFYTYSTAITPDELSRFALHQMIRETGDEFVRVNGIGEQIGPDNVFVESLRAAARSQWRIQQHFGPAGPQFDAFQTVASEFDLADLRWSWGHAGTVTPAQMEAHAATGIGVTLTRGPARSWIDTGIRAGAATDGSNVSWINPWMQIYFFTTRRNQQGAVSMDGQQISRLEALHLYTLGSTWFSREDHELGSFEVGKKADLVVLNQDFLTVSDEQLRKTRSLLTLLNGRVVHAAGEFANLAPDDTQPFPDRFPESIEL
jgi:hypothetical protein